MGRNMVIDETDALIGDLAYRHEYSVVTLSFIHKEKHMKHR